MAMVTLGETARLPGLGKTTLARAIELARVYPFPAPTVAADTTVTATGPPRDSNHYGRDCGAGGTDCRIAGGRRIVAAATRRCAGGSGQVAGSGRAARRDEPAAIAVLVATAGRPAERPCGALRLS